MTPILRRSLVAVSIATLACAGVLSGCNKPNASDGTTTDSTTAKMKSEARELGSDAKQEMKKAGVAVEDGVITTKVKTALLADPDVKGLSIDVDTKDGVVTLKGTADKSANADKAVQIAANTGGVKSVDNQLVVKASS